MNPITVISIWHSTTIKYDKSDCLLGKDPINNNHQFDECAPSAWRKLRTGFPIQLRVPPLHGEQVGPLRRNALDKETVPTLSSYICASFCNRFSLSHGSVRLSHSMHLRSVVKIPSSRSGCVCLGILRGLLTMYCNRVIIRTCLTARSWRSILSCLCSNFMIEFVRNLLRRYSLECTISSQLCHGWVCGDRLS